ncbi:MAG TPA: [LysW]-aminoadipate kinase [Chloroflexota bacterium]|nr:[LysW]-aminoadipate kinase [Chloroflexota bacterium]
MLVVKLGGGSGMDIAACVADIAALWQAGTRMVVLHGGADETSELGEQLGHPPQFVESASGMRSRYTDRRTLEMLAMACAGRRNVTLVEALQQAGVNAVGLAGVDGAVLRGPRKTAITVVEAGRRRVIRDDLSGKVTEVNTHLLHLLLAGGYLPVLCPPALSTEGQAINIDGDRAAAAVAGALGAETLVLLTDVPGLLRDRNDPSTVIERLSATEVDGAMGLATGGMRKKVLGAQEAIAGGVGRAVLALGRGPEPLRRALAGGGTWIEAVSHHAAAGAHQSATPVAAVGAREEQRA